MPREIAKLLPIKKSPIELSKRGTPSTKDKLFIAKSGFSNAVAKKGLLTKELPIRPSKFTY